MDTAIENVSGVVFVWLYLACGVLNAAALYYMLHHANHVLEEHDDDGEDFAVTRELERTVGMVPGGALTLLAVFFALWPLVDAALLFIMIKDRKDEGTK